MKSPGCHISRNSSRLLIFFSLLLTINSVALAQNTAPDSNKHPQPNDPAKPKLEGTYTGTVNVPSRNLSGEGTLTINGDGFILKTQDGAITGRITAVRTGNYTAVALRLTEPAAATSPQSTPNSPPETLSLRLQQSGDKIHLTSAEGEDTMFRTALNCPDPPACKESDLCRPFCVVRSNRRARRSH